MNNLYEDCKKCRKIIQTGELKNKIKKENEFVNTYDKLFVIAHKNALDNRGNIMRIDLDKHIYMPKTKISPRFFFFKHRKHN